MATAFASKVTVAKTTVRAAPVKALPVNAQRFASAAGAAVVTLGLTLSANAAVVKLGGDDGSLAFVPATLTVSAGEEVVFTNNAGFPHNIVFDEDAVPAGVDAGKISNEDYLNAPGETVVRKFDKAGTYSYYCEPHQGAGMVGKIIVK